MKPPPFIYKRPETLEEALMLLSEHGSDASIIAGGQSLVPMMNFRLTEPRILIDINRLEELKGIADSGVEVRLGALTRYVEIEHNRSLACTVPLLTQAMPLIAHPGIRNRGTIGGSIALADPAAETPACCVGLDASIQLQSRARGLREVPAKEFFQGIYTTSAEEDEIVTGIRLDENVKGRRFAIREISPRHGDFALAGAIAAATPLGGKLSNVRLVFFAVSDQPVVAEIAQRSLEGASIDDREALNEAMESLSAEIEFRADHQLSSEYRERLAKTLLSRVVADLREEYPHE